VIAIVAAAVLSYLAAVAWGMGLPAVGMPLTALIVLACAGVLVAVSRAADPGLWALNAAGRIASAFLMGATLSAMLLGHHYLTAPSMSIEPLKRFVQSMAWGLGTRALLAGIGLGLWAAGSAAGSASANASTLFLAVRWGMGVIGPAVATFLTWKTVQIRSTQSATGILYVVVVFCFLGELTSQLLHKYISHR
jgi:hypothetical protein